ncbi:hypothetical protein DCC81_24745 [Chitinophaga parva]|uniref:Phage capsid-like C-terminal domain-containing protein n=1 Tax=Chitinophaga parva TaxID=2169414 RepID=A0A2T7BBM7_9BACT|nr:phage major capsid protein [Chitinophaga parva]PUZ21799.1 hypothetical protein DCC81_24745 [Chitinophaga parva]
MEINEVKTAITEVLKPVMEDTKAAKTAAEAAKTAADGATTEIKTVKDEVKGLSDWKVEKDEADKKNQEVLDKLILDSQKKGGAGPATPGKKTFQEALTIAVEEKTDDIAKFARKEKGVDRVILELKDVGLFTTGNIAGTTVWGAQMRPGIIENPTQIMHMREILAGGNIGPGTDFYFMRQEATQGAPAPHEEGTQKAAFNLNLKEDSVKIETIAGFTKITRRVMNNVPGFIAFLNSQLPEELLLVEDEQLLYGSGDSPELKGILTDGNFVASTSAATILVEKINDDLGVFQDTYKRVANRIVLRPIDVQNLFKLKAAGSGEYDLPKNVVFVGNQLYISGVPVAASTAVHSGDYFLGDFVRGSQFLIQEGMRIEIFEQDDKNVQQNLLTARIEETGCLPVYGNNYFMKGSVPEVA